MDQYIDNNLEGCNIGGNYTGGNTYNITLYQDIERKFIVTHNANIKPVSYFTGRETELKELRQKIEEGRKSVLVSGMGGIGKTHICRKLFEEYLNKHTNGQDIYFRHIGYIEYDGDMDSSLQRCLKYKEQDNPEQNREAAWRELEYLASDGKLLLFVDNVNVPIGSDSSLKKLRSIHGAIVLTSRRTSFGKEFEPYRIGFLGTEQCKKIYERIRYEDSNMKVPKEDIMDLEYVIEKLAAWHTITIEFLAHLAMTKNWKVRELRSELEDKGFRLKYKDEEDKLINIQEEYEKLYDLSVLAEAEKNVLEAFSVFPYIPLAAVTCNQWLLSDAGVSEDDDILMGLYQKGWLQFDIEQESYALHPVFAQFIYEKTRPSVEMHSGLIKACQKHLKIPENGLPLGCQQYESYAESIIKKVDMGKSWEYVGFLSALAYLSLYVAEYEKAEKWYGELLEISKSILEDNDLNIATIYNNLAVVYLRKGQYERAENLAQKSLQIRSNKLGENHPDTADSYNVLAGVYERQRKHTKAEELYKKNISICEQVHGKNHPDTARNYNNLAYVYIRQKEYVKAEELLNRSISICEQVYGEDYPNIAIILDNLAQVNEAQGKYVEAEIHYKKSMKISKKAYGENHPDVAKSYYNLAELYRKKKQYQKALVLFAEAYKIQSSRQELDYRDTMAIYQSIRETYFEWNPEGDFKQWIEERMKL